LQGNLVCEIDNYGQLSGDDNNKPSCHALAFLSNFTRSRAGGDGIMQSQSQHITADVHYLANGNEPQFTHVNSHGDVDYRSGIFEPVQ
jgi:hypothetical protein